MKDDGARPRQLALPFDAPAWGSGGVRVPSSTLAGRQVASHRLLRLPKGLPPGARDEARALLQELTALVGGEVTLHVHDNRSTMVSYRHHPDALHLRVHHMFLGCGPEVVRAIAEYTRTRSSRSGRLLERYVRENQEAIRPGVAPVRRARGRVHDLREIFDRLNARYFDGTIEADVGWGRGSPQRRRRSIRMGAYNHDTRTILVHPALDREEVPGYFVEFVVYHEMLHQAVPASRDETGRRRFHPPEFRERERLFHDFERARGWEKEHLNLLLRPSSP